MRGGWSISSYGIPPVCQLHTSVAIKDKITVSMYMNIHAAAFLLGCLPAQRCGAVMCCLLPCAKVPAPGRRLDVVPDVVPHAAQPVLKTRHSLGASSHVGDPGRSSLLPSRSGSRGKRNLLVALAFQRAAQQIALCWACLLAVLNVLYIVPVVSDPQVPPGLVALSPNTGCSSQLDVVLTSFQTSFHMDLVGEFLLGQQCLLGLYAHAIFSPRRSNWWGWHCDFQVFQKKKWLSWSRFFFMGTATHDSLVLGRAQVWAPRA